MTVGIHKQPGLRGTIEGEREGKVEVAAVVIANRCARGWGFEVDGSCPNGILAESIIGKVHAVGGGCGVSRLEADTAPHQGAWKQVTAQNHAAIAAHYQDVALHGSGRALQIQ